MPTTIHVTDQGNQNIGGNKIFTGVATFSGQQVNLIDTALNLSGVGDMTFEGTNINFINSPVFISGTNLRVVGDVIGNNLVYNTGNQTITGIKTFEDSIKTKNIISTEDYNLLISGSSTAMAAGDINITPGKSSFSLGKINLTAAGDQVDGNINFKGNIDINNYGQSGPGDLYPSGLGHSFKIYKSGLNDYNQRVSFKSFEVNQTGVYTLNKTPIYSDGQIYISGNPILTGMDLSSYATTANLALTGSTLATNIASTGSTLQTNINTLTTNLATTGSTLNTKINNLSGYINSQNSNIVFTTGDQSISGIKTFNNDVVFTGTAIFNEIDLSDTDNILLSGVNIQIVSGSITLTNMPTISGNPLITGVDLSSYLTSSTASATYATITNLAGTGSTLATNLASTGSTLSTNLENTGSTLQTNINNLSGYINSTSSNIVFTTGNQTISGVKTFIGNHIISGNTTITGHLSATSKSFLIDHPTQVGKKLQYGSLESPYHGIRLTDKNKISADIVKVYLPEYISSLVNDEKINIQLTNINHDKILFIKEVNINENNFIVGMNRGWFDKNEYEFYWSFTAERKDIPKLTVEF